jgi:hypothetical protein
MGRLHRSAAVDLPAPEGELFWADYNDMYAGTLCVFWARDDRITRHDCVVPGSTVSSTLIEPIDD